MAVRRESVRLELEDHFSQPIARAAVNAQVLRKSLDDLNNAGRRTDLDRVKKPLGDIDKGARGADKSINQLTGRLRLLRDASLSLGPALVPIGAAGIPLVAGLATQLGLMAGAVGVSAVALSGLGDGLDSLNKYQLEPTDENLRAMRAEMEKLGPAAQQFVEYLDSITPQLKAIQMTARAGLFPGLEDGIDSLLDRGPEVREVVSDIALTLGDLARSGGEALSSERFDDFFRYLQNDAGPLLSAFGRTVGNVFEGLANMFVGFAPTTRDFSEGLERMTADFARWSRSLESNDSFQGFLAYIRETGPQVVELLGQMTRAFVGIVQAAAPIGQALLPVLTQIAEAFADIASSPIGTPLLTAAAGMVAFNRAAGATAATLGKLKAAGGLAGAFAGSAGMGATLAAMLVGMELIDRSVDKVFDDGKIKGIGQSLKDLGDTGWLTSLDNGLSSVLPGVSSRFDEATESVGALDTELAALVRSGRGDEAAAMFEQIIAEARESGVSVDEVRAAFGQYGDALRQTTDGNNLFAGAVQRAAGAIRTETEATYASVQAMRAKRAANLAAFDAETQWRQALNEATAAANRNKAGIRGNSEAALENRGRLSALAAAWDNQSEAVRANEGRQKAARRAFINAAEGMGVSADAARKLAGRILDIPEKREVKVTAATDAARAAIDSLRGLLSSIPDENVTVFVRRQMTASNFGPREGFAAGGLSPKRYALPVPADLTDQETAS